MFLYNNDIPSRINFVEEYFAGTFEQKAVSVDLFDLHDNDARDCPARLITFL